MSVNISTRVSENNLDASAEKLDEYLVKIANGDREALWEKELLLYYSHTADEILPLYDSFY